MKDYKDRNNFILRTAFLIVLMPKCVLKSAPQKLNFIMAKAISKRYTLNCSTKCPCTFLPSNTASLSIKTTFCETNNILFSINY